jgi:hypothetical protein
MYIGQGLKPDLCSDRPATDSLNHGMAAWPRHRCRKYCGNVQSWKAELLTAGILKIQVFWDVMLSPIVNIHLTTVKYGVVSQNTWMHNQV